MTDRDQLLHLADRARRGVLLPAEGALLADGITDMAARITTLEAVCESNKRAYKGAVQAAWAAESRAEQAEAARDRLRRARDHWADHAARLVDRTVTAEAANARVRELHHDAYPDTPGRSCAAGCGTWPCPTTRALVAQQPTT
ncbi:hypothetical protein ACWCXC_31715 [Streptomyces sp. NPDC001515]